MSKLHDIQKQLVDKTIAVYHAKITQQRWNDDVYKLVQDTVNQTVSEIIEAVKKTILMILRNYECSSDIRRDILYKMEEALNKMKEKKND